MLKRVLFVLVLGVFLIGISRVLYADQIEASLKNMASENINISNVVKQQNSYIVYGTSKNFVALEKLRNAVKKQGIGEPYLELLGKQKDTQLYRFKMEIRL